MENQEKGKVVKTEVSIREMSVVMPDGTRVPVKGKVTETYYENGVKDTHVEVEKPLGVFGQSK